MIQPLAYATVIASSAAQRRAASGCCRSPSAPFVRAEAAVGERDREQRETGEQPERQQLLAERRPQAPLPEAERGRRERVDERKHEELHPRERGQPGEHGEPALGGPRRPREGSPRTRTAAASASGYATGSETNQDE